MGNFTSALLGRFQSALTHLFRHSLATDLLRSGASFAEIGQLLRHRSIDSTRIYAKLDIEKLRELSLPWPGGVQ
ncbi:tyrosine-type recombinase/integrase [Ensifer sp. ENS05]|nr:tyrosine-type recombinase/integrase [Ensifer sp. ENS05]